MVQVDLDYVYDADPAQEQRNLDALIERIQKMQVTTVFLQGFADPEGTRLASALYFPNRELPMRADLFRTLSRALKTKRMCRCSAGCRCCRSISAPASRAWRPGARADPKAYQRVSPFDAAARKKLIAVYADMAKSAPIDGVLFHDDALLSDYEDASLPALMAYRDAGLPQTLEALRAPGTIDKWTAFKTEALIKLTDELTVHMRRHRPLLQTARNIYAPAVLDAKSRQWFAQDYDRFLKTYDYTAVEAMPQMENVPDDQTAAWMQSLVAAVSHRPGGLRGTIFELQTVDWRKQQAGEDRAVPAASSTARFVSGRRRRAESRLLSRTIS